MNNEMLQDIFYRILKLTENFDDIIDGDNSLKEYVRVHARINFVVICLKEKMRLIESYIAEIEAENE